MQTMIQTSRRLDSFLHDASQNFEVFSNIQEWNKKSKTYRGWCPFQGLSNGTTLMYCRSNLARRYLRAENIYRENERMPKESDIFKSEINENRETKQRVKWVLTVTEVGYVLRIWGRPKQSYNRKRKWRQKKWIEIKWETENHWKQQDNERKKVVTLKIK